ncbi:hypothetical protein BST28_20540 [Mycolicibacter kumamotonensis]|uniref:Uncharacterized protein n=1 Tax=Mycolicibacter kumamotonensis TaxID=354243 RepID=A0A1X0DWH6_9MYCO|nr:hypothetical protein BST28_20540 [Mycolicibacter kumamotonensis]
MHAPKPARWSTQDGPPLRADQSNRKVDDFAPLAGPRAKTCWPPVNATVAHSKVAAIAARVAFSLP